MIEERHRHRYEVNPDIVEQLEAKGMRFVGRDQTNKRMEIMELADHPYFVAVQYHPEFLSRPLRTSPPFLGENGGGGEICESGWTFPAFSPHATFPKPGFILAACGKLRWYLRHRPETPTLWSNASPAKPDSPPTENGHHHGGENGNGNGMGTGPAAGAEPVPLSPLKAVTGVKSV